MIGFSIVVVDEWIVKNQASYLGVGTLAYLQYGRTLMKVPIGVFGMAAGVAAYPTISGLVAVGSVVEAYGLLCRAVRLMLLLTFAAQVCLTIAGFEAVYLIWGLFANRFTIADARETATVLTYLCLGLSGWAAQTVISRGFYALESTWLPTMVGTAVAAIMVPVYVVLRQQDGAIGLAVASSMAIMAYVMLLGWLQRRRFEREALARGATLQGFTGHAGCGLPPPGVGGRYRDGPGPHRTGSAAAGLAGYARRHDPAPGHPALHVRDWHLSRCGSPLLGGGRHRT